jgi:hypothetical protein
MRLARLFLLGASLFVCGTAFSQQATNSAGPPGIEIVSCNWLQLVVSSNPPPSLIPDSPPLAFPENRPKDPTPVIPQKATSQNWYVYSATVINREKKPIKAMLWNYVFRDPVTHNELKRHPNISSVKIGPNQKKTLQFKRLSSPPKVVNADVLNGKSSPERPDWSATVSVAS